MPIFSRTSLAKPPGFKVLMKAAAPTKVGNTSGKGRIILKKRLPGRSVLIVSQASEVPIIEADIVTKAVNSNVLKRGDRVCLEKSMFNGSDPLVIFLQIR